MFLILLILGCNRTTCDSKTLTKHAEAQCEAWMACPEFAPPIADSYEDLDACVKGILTIETEICEWATDARCKGELVPAKVNDCVARYRESIRTCKEEPWCQYIDTGLQDDGMYRGVDGECTPIYE